MKVYIPLSYKMSKHWRGGFNLLKGITQSILNKVELEWIVLYSEENYEDDFKKIESNYQFFRDPVLADEYLNSNYREDCLLFSLGNSNLWANDLRRVTYIPDFQHEYFPNFFDSEEIFRRRFNYQVEAAMSDGVWVPSQSVSRDLSRFLINLPSKILCQYFPLLREPDKMGSDFKNAKNCSYFLCVSQNWKHKNISTLIEAWSMTANNDSEFKLIIAGQGFEGMISNNQGIEFRFNPSDSELFSLYKNAYAFVLPSLFEGWSTPVEEAIAHNLPMVLSNLPVLREQVKDGAVFFDPNSPDDLNKSILKIIKDSNFTRHLGENTRNNLRISSDEFGKNVFSFFENCLL